jgi:hypothetical protein
MFSKVAPFYVVFLLFAARSFAAPNPGVVHCKCLLRHVLSMLMQRSGDNGVSAVLNFLLIYVNITNLMTEPMYVVYMLDSTPSLSFS